MEIDRIYQKCQSIISDVPTIILGSGASIPYGLPSMGQLAQYLKDNVKPEKTDQDIWEEFNKELDKEWDLEKALQNVEVTEDLFSQILNLTWDTITKADLILWERIVCQNEKPPLYRLLKHFLRTSNPIINIVTTNYDRIAEYCASKAKAIYYTGFPTNHINHFNPVDLESIESMKYPGLSGSVFIWKVHGSLDWFEKEKQYYSIPLSTKILPDFTPSIVTPGVTKFKATHLDPFRSLFRRSDLTISTSSSFLAIGYGFNDEHVQPRLISQLENEGKPILILTKSLTDATKEILSNGTIKNFIAIEDDNKKGCLVYIDSMLSPTNITDQKLWDFETFLNQVINI